MPDSAPSRLDQQIAFLVAADALKGVVRANVLMDGSRAENSAEHAWHVCLWALILAPDTVDLDAVLRQLILHDIVEIDAGDHPIHLDTGPQSAAEAAAAERLFGLLPSDIGTAFHAEWREFEDGRTDTARFAKLMDHCQPILQVLDSPVPRDDHLQVVRDNISTGRASDLGTRWPDIRRAIDARLAGDAPQSDDLNAALRFLAEADRLKTVTRATLLCDASRYENSAEHSWHLTLYALVLADQARPEVDINLVIKMLILHDLVEIDAGDNPIFGTLDHAAIAAQEEAAADRIFGLLPAGKRDVLRRIWEEFEAATTPSAQFAKSLDRFQPPIQNLASGGGSWTDYNVTPEQIEARVGSKIAIGAPALWNYAKARIAVFFAAQT